VPGFAAQIRGRPGVVADCSSGALSCLDSHRRTGRYLTANTSPTISAAASYIAGMAFE